MIRTPFDHRADSACVGRVKHRSDIKRSVFAKNEIAQACYDDRVARLVRQQIAIGFLPWVGQARAAAELH